MIKLVRHKKLKGPNEEKTNSSVIKEKEGNTTGNTQNNENTVHLLKELSNSVLKLQETVQALEEKVRKQQDYIEILWKITPELAERLKEKDISIKNLIGAIDMNVPDEKSMKRLLRRRQENAGRKIVQKVPAEEVNSLNPSIKLKGKIKEMVLFWNTLQFPKLFFKYPGKEGTIENPSNRLVEAVSKLRKLLNGHLLEHKYTVEDFKFAASRFQTMAFDEHYAPAGEYKKKLQKTLLGDFLLNSWVMTQRHRSLFLYCMENEPVIRVQIELTDPDTYEFLIEQYHKYMGTDASFNFTGDQILAFSNISNKLITFLENNDKNFSTPLNSRTLTKLLFKCAARLEKEWVKDGISPSLLNHDKMFNAWFPGFLRREGYIKSKTSERAFGY